MMQQCAVLLWCCSVVVLQCYSASVLKCCSVIVLQCYSAAVLQCCNVGVLQCYSAAVLCWFSAIVIMFNNATDLLFSKKFHTDLNTDRATNRGPSGPKNCRNKKRKCLRGFWNFSGTNHIYLFPFSSNNLEDDAGEEKKTMKNSLISLKSPTLSCVHCWSLVQFYLLLCLRASVPRLPIY